MNQIQIDTDFGLRDQVVLAVDELLAVAVGAALAGFEIPDEKIEATTPLVIAFVKANVIAYDNLLSVLEHCNCEAAP